MVRVTTDDQGAFTVVLADDHAVVRAGLRLLLEGQPGCRVVAEAGTTADALRYVRATARACSCSTSTCRPAEPRGDPRACWRVSPRTAIVVLTMQEDPAFAREALRAGRARLRAQGGRRRRAARGGPPARSRRAYLNPRLGARLAAEPPLPPGPPDDLTEREVEVLRLIALGHTNGEIADRLFLSVRTIESHRAHIQQKIRRTTRAELVRYALEHKLVEV